MNLCNITTIKTLMQAHNISFRKEYGQNFLIENYVPENIADSAVSERTEAVVEIGPGIGCLTKELALRAPCVKAVEIDKGLIPVLALTLGEFRNVEVINSDVLKTDLRALIEGYNERNVCVCANLPYYITTPIIMYLLESGIKFESITVMVQNEVASRLCAKAGSSDYGAITAVLKYYGQAEKLFTVPAGCFMPMPKVNSAVVRITPYSEPVYAPKDEKLFFRVIKAAFGQRRKTLVNALSHEFSHIGKEDIAKTIVDCGFDVNIRGEKLDCGDFCRLADAISEFNG
ncbi:MAG: 16S rRNA (adenine(1518)-N(6)/adenine(1519)-N(6))-dimethyltransferase RsmA [Clostridia bacterium]|nr:16S rRNA (adenine(1518)-N(6)/adenine(1519)-N(6))-dimethyltransferase RsmA [Clostridia bacterium]